MTASAWVALGASCVYLALALVALRRVARSPLALPLGLLCLALLTWNAAAFLHHATGDLRWHWLDRAASPWTTPLVLFLVLTFVGSRRRFRTLVWATFGAFGALSVATLAAFVAPGARAFADSPTWAVVHLCAAAPLLAFSGALLVRHWRRAGDEFERVRAGLLLAALLIGVTGTTDLWAGMGFAVPRLGLASTLLSTLLMAAVALRYRLIEEPAPFATVAWAAGASVAGVAGYMAVFRLLGSDPALLALGTGTVTLAVVAATRLAALRRASHRQRLEGLATVGRFSAQMAHDLRNPITAMKGGVQFLRQESAGGARLSDHAPLLELLEAQVDRLSREVDHYHRMGRGEPRREATALEAIVGDVLAMQRYATNPRVRVTSDLARDLPLVPLDRDLLASVLENLLRNAVEAMPAGGEITVRTERATVRGRAAVALAVEDTGPGMDARTRERALDDFYTTKAGGSGFGLSFARRVADAHGGRIEITGRSGPGTIVRLTFPADPPLPEPPANGIQPQ